MTTKTIDITDATNWAKNWQTKHSSIAKAFLIPIDDLVACLEEMNVLESDGDGKYTFNDVPNAGVRTYLAIDPKDTGNGSNGEKLLIVGTSIDSKGIHRDIIEGGVGTYAAMTGSGVFDFTEPCPNNCDTESPLYNP